MVEAELAAIRALRRAGQHHEVQARLLELAAQYPHDALVQYETACIHDLLGHERAAIPYYVAALRQGLAGDELRGAYLGLGSTYRTVGQYQESKQILLEGLTRFPEAVELKVFLAMTLYNLGDHREAMRLLLHVIAATSADPTTQGYRRALQFYAENLDARWE